MKKEGKRRVTTPEAKARIQCYADLVDGIKPELDEVSPVYNPYKSKAQGPDMKYLHKTANNKAIKRPAKCGHLKQEKMVEKAVSGVVGSLSSIVNSTNCELSFDIGIGGWFGDISLNEEGAMQQVSSSQPDLGKLPKKAATKKG